MLVTSQRALINWWVCIHNKHRKTTPFLITARSSTPCCVCQYIRCPTPRCITQRKTILAQVVSIQERKLIQRISWHRFCQHDGKTGRTLDRWQQFHLVYRFRTKIPSRVLVKFCTEKRGLSWIFLQHLGSVLQYITTWAGCQHCKVLETVESFGTFFLAINHSGIVNKL